MLGQDKASSLWIPDANYDTPLNSNSLCSYLRTFQLNTFQESRIPQYRPLYETDNPTPVAESLPAVLFGLKFIAASPCGSKDWHESKN